MNIVTLLKPGKNHDCIANFRPISLLNVDIKIYAKLSAQSLKEVLPRLIQPDQMEFVPGRQTSDATRWVINIVHYAERCQTPSLLLSIDAKKAFN